MTGADDPASETLHASCAALGDRALLILGASGSGKSALALGLIARGASLVSDDRTRLERRGDDLHASAPAPLLGLIEARGLGLLRLPAALSARVALAVDLDAPSERLPPRRDVRLLGVAIPLLSAPKAVAPDALILALAHGPPIDPDGEFGRV